MFKNYVPFTNDNVISQIDLNVVFFCEIIFKSSL